jgi:hypothetical protein
MFWLLLHFGWNGTNIKKRITNYNFLNNNTFNKKHKDMMNLTQDEKARLYNDMIMRYQRMQEEVRQIKAENFEVSDSDQQKINLIESKMKRLFNDSQKLY